MTTIEVTRRRRRRRHSAIVALTVITSYLVTLAMSEQSRALGRVSSEIEGRVTAGDALDAIDVKRMVAESTVHVSSGGQQERQRRQDEVNFPPLPQQRQQRQPQRKETKQRQQQQQPPPSVPRIIWQTSKSEQIPPEANATVSTWLRQNPNWEHRLLTDADVDAFFRTEFRNSSDGSNRVYDAYGKLPMGVMKADMWRVAVVYRYGGVYADLDTRSVRPIDAWLRPDKCKAIIGIESPHAFCNWAFAASVPGHPVFERALYRIVEKIERDGRVKVQSDFVATYTGPMSLTGATREVLQSEHEYATDIWQDKADRARAREMGLCLEDYPFFNHENVAHDFASISWNESESYTRWRKEADEAFGEDGPPPKKKGRKAIHVVGGRAKVETLRGGEVLK